MMDSDLAELYGFSTKVLNQAVRRNVARFPEDFMFQLTPVELQCLRSQVVTLKRSRRGTHRKYAPYAFTEQGVAMLSSILRSLQAVQVNITIMRAFVKLREVSTGHQNILNRMESVKRKLTAQDGLHRQHTAEIQAIFSAIRQLMETRKRKPRIGFKL